MAKQVEIPEAFADLFKPARNKAFYGGRGSGKSHSFAKALLLIGGQSRKRILCGREVQKSIKDSVKQLLDDQIEQLGMQHFYQSLRDEIRGANGTQILFTGLSDLTIDQVKSFEGVDIFWAEEAQTLSERSLETVIPTIRKPGSELWFSWNPRNAKDPVDQRFRGEALPDNSIVKKVNYTDNPFFPAELEEERLYCKQYKPDRYAHIWLGEYEPTAIGAIWDRQTIKENRRSEMPQIDRIVVAVDPAVSHEKGSDEHGIVVCGIGADKRGYVLDDQSLRGTPMDWARRVTAVFDHWQADAVVIEVNQGGDMVRHTLNSVRLGLPIIEVRATRGKHVRAEPISALYSLGRISHVGTFPELEDQMCLMTAEGYQGEGSPDRCFAAGTMVETDGGPKPIEEVQQGDRVWTRRGLRPVLASSLTDPNAKVYDVQFSDGSSLTGTGNHPVFVEGRGFTRLDALVWGDTVNHLWSNEEWAERQSHSTSRKASRKPCAPVSVVGLSERAERVPVFNLTVEGENEYYANGILVHNCDALVWAFTELFPTMIEPKYEDKSEFIPSFRAAGGWMA